MSSCRLRPLVEDILTSTGCKPLFMLDKEFTKYQNYTHVEQITELNRKLDFKNTFSTFK
jgi:hypothetical protein